MWAMCYQSAHSPAAVNSHEKLQYNHSTGLHFMLQSPLTDTHIVQTHTDTHTGLLNTYISTPLAIP